MRREGGERLGGETSGPLFMLCVMQSRTDMSVISVSALPVRFRVDKIFNKPEISFRSLIISQECVMSKLFK